ncbi:MAG TPA: alpha/beta fold hydrolase, partial [Xanthobacteraceae bacterium]|nr:alpha/beta fold hydrolase [Xanthobacteraceae bacterium]
MTTFVLVHGAWHGGWCYKRVARLLRQAGHEVYTPTLTGLGEREPHDRSRHARPGHRRRHQLRGIVGRGPVRPFIWRHGHRRRRRADRG